MVPKNQRELTAQHSAINESPTRGCFSSYVATRMTDEACKHLKTVQLFAHHDEKG